MTDIKEKIVKNSILTCLIIFIILLLVHSTEAIFIRMDETFFGENFINKIFGIILLGIILNIIGWNWADIGFKKENILKNIGIGFSLGLLTFLIAYTIEILILNTQGQFVGFGIFTTGFSLTGDTVIHTGMGFILMCIFFNIINVIMEEGTFRGLFTKILSTNHSLKLAILFQAFLFGVWHIVTPMHNLVDGSIGFSGFIGLSVGYIILAGLMGIKWGLLQEMTGSLYAGMADHFFNNCIATNLLHVITIGGVDDLMIVRVLIAQILSFTFIIMYYKFKYKKHIISS